MYAKSYVLAKIILSLYANFPEAEVDKWLADAEVIECTEDKVILYSPSLDSLKILQEVCYSYILDVVKNLLQCNALLEIWGPTDLDHHRQNQSTRSNYANANYSFSNYIVGTSNEIAVKAARAVSSAPGNAIQEVSGSIPLISTKGKDREPKGSLSFSFAKKFCAGANRAARGADELFIKHDRPITAFLNLFDVISHLRICRVSAKAAVIVPFPAPAVFARAGL